MIVDSKGNLFENRRKEGNDRRKDLNNTTGGRRKEGNDRRKTPSGERIRKSKSNKK